MKQGNNDPQEAAGNPAAFNYNKGRKTHYL